MSVLCCSIPEFLFALARRQLAQDATRPLALLGADARILAVSAPARGSGVAEGMTSRQALARCPDIQLHPLNVSTCQAEHDALLSVLAQTGLPIEAQGWGSAYVSLREVARERADAQAVCADLGRQVRRVLGEALQPALGWDTGKFTARAASAQSRPGQMRLVSHSDEAHFLDPLPLSLLPLPTPALRYLDWLGIRTLGRFARLPVAAVQQRFGAAGKLAQQWAQGRDDRPVRPTTHAQPDPISVDIAAPTGSQEGVLDTAMAALKPHLGTMNAQLQGCRRIHGALRFLDGSTRAFSHLFLEPTCAPKPIRAALACELRGVTWSAEATALDLIVLDVAELTPTQLSLFPELDSRQADREPFAAVVAKLAPRYGSIFWHGQVADEYHPVAERRIGWVSARVGET